MSTHPLFDLFLPHNQHWNGLDAFCEQDPQLRRLKDLPFIYQSHLLEQIPLHVPGIYLLSGGRQVGKSTFLKQLMEQSLRQKQFTSSNIIFLSGELIRNEEQLHRILKQFLQMPQDSSFVILDEVQYVEGWDRAVKYLADSGFLETTTLILSGSNSLIIQEAMKRFPGRRGKADQVNFHYHPLSFREYVDLQSSKQVSLDELYQFFSLYLKTGGYLTAINELAKEGKLSWATLNTYREWVFGDFLSYRKSERSLREILEAIVNRYGSQITWNALSKDLSIDHHKTVAEYCELLMHMDAVFIQSALSEHKMKAAPKKAKKIYFSDPFIFHALSNYIWESENPWESNIQIIERKPYLSNLIEGVVVNHCRRFFPTFYIKAEREIDLAIVAQKQLYALEVKWTNQLRSHDFKYLKKHKNRVVAAKVKERLDLNGLNVVPLPEFLYSIESSKVVPF